MNAPTICFGLSTEMLSDHLGRLYVRNGSAERNAFTAEVYHHIDNPVCVIHVNAWRGKRSWLVATEGALAEMVDDFDYQAEFSEGVLAAQYRRALKVCEKAAQR